MTAKESKQLRADNHTLRLATQEAKLQAANALQALNDMWWVTRKEYFEIEAVKGILKSIPGVQKIVDAREELARKEEEEWNRVTVGGKSL